MLTAMYARTAAADVVGLADQEARCRAYAVARGWAIVGAWRDVGSGLTGDHPGHAAPRAADAARPTRVPTAVAGLPAAAATAAATAALVDGGPALNPTWSASAVDLRRAGPGGVEGGAAPRSRRPWRRR